MLLSFLYSMKEVIPFLKTLLIRLFRLWPQSGCHGWGDYISNKYETRRKKRKKLTVENIYMEIAHRGWGPYPGWGGQTEVTPDQTSFERTHVPGALELHGLEKASSALLSGQWSGTCLIIGHFGLGRSDQRQFQAHTSLIRGRFERTLVWPETNSSDFFSSFFNVFLLTFVVSGKRQQ